MLSENSIYLTKPFNNLDRRHSIAFFKQYTDKPVNVGENGFAKYNPSMFTKVAAHRSVSMSGFFSVIKVFPRFRNRNKSVVYFCAIPD